MHIVKGNKIVEFTPKDLVDLMQEYVSVEVDIGTGDGALPYKKAQINKGTLYIGIDPIEKQMLKFSKKALRNKIKNALFIVGNAENLGEVFGEYVGLVNTVHILFPWGSLLKAVAQPDAVVLEKIYSILKAQGQLNIVLGYDETAEPSEVKRLNLQTPDEAYFEREAFPVYRRCGFALEKFVRVGRENPDYLTTSWMKKLRFGKTRSFFELKFNKQTPGIIT